MPKRVVLTGGGGFVGAHCLEYWLHATDWEILVIDSFRHKGYVSRALEAFGRASNVVDYNAGSQYGKRVKMFTHDLTVPIDKPLENQLMDRKMDDRGVVTEKKIDIIFNLASDSAVERSTSDPTHCWRNNCELIANMLEFARVVKPSLFLHVSTDEVYGEAPALPSSGHWEWSTILPSNPYAASKAAQEALCISYWRTYDMPIILTNCMNIIGEFQDPEKFLPKIIQSVAQGKEIPVYADKLVEGQSTTFNHVDEQRFAWYIGSRVYLDARNKADALMFLANRKPARYSDGTKQPDRYNICGENELNNLELAQKVAEIMGKELKYKLVPSESARPGYDRRYALDGGKLKNLGWNPPTSLDVTLKRIVEWTMKNPHWLV
jgi:dTDP-glucose 4,6-dehydratase